MDACVEVPPSGTALFRYVLRADMSRMRLPAAQSPERVDGLWRHTCFEAFVRVSGAADYCEFNFAPSRHWAAYRFSGYRDGMTPIEGVPTPKISVRRFPDRLETDAAVNLVDVIAAQGSAPLQIGLCAVLEEENGSLSHWALKHGPGKADFHGPCGFALELALTYGR